MTLERGSEASQLTAAAVRRMVDDQAPETAALDFKSDVYGNRDADRRELADDVAAFANADGGLILIGVGEDESGCAVSADGVPVSDDEANRMSQIIADNISPVPVTDIQLIPSDDGRDRGYIAIHVPKSTAAPHGTKINSGYRYPVRHGRTTRYLKENEIASRYQGRRDGADKLRARVDEIAQDALGRIDGERPWVLVSLVAERPGDLSISDATLRAFSEEIVGSPACDDIVNYSSSWMRVRVAPGRLIADGSVNSEAKSRWAFAERFADGAAVCGLILPHQEFANQPDGVRRAMLFDHLLSSCTLSSVRRAARYATEAGAGGDALVRVDIVWPDHGDFELYIGNEAWQYSGHTLGTHGLSGGVDAAFLTVPLGSLPFASASLVAATAALVSELAQNFGLAELGQFTLAGELRSAGWNGSSPTQKLACRWADAAQVPIV